MQQPLRFQLGEPARDLGRRILAQAVLQRVRLRLAVDQAANAALFGRHARIARLPRLLACLGTLIDPIRCRHAPSPESPFTPCILAPAGPAVKQAETSLQGRLPKKPVSSQALPPLVGGYQNK